MTNNAINLYSVRLPYKAEDLIKKTNGKGLIEARVNVEGLINEPPHTIPLEGLIRKHSYHENTCSVKKRKTWYRTSRSLGFPPFNLKHLYNDTFEQMSKHGFININIRFTRLVFKIKDDIYTFVLSSKGRGNVLKQINSEPIGKMSIKKQTDLLMGDLSFCAPSNCKIVYKQEIECEP